RTPAPRTGVYFFDDRYGDHSASYTAVDARATRDHWPTEPARLTCDVAFEATIWAAFRRQHKHWIATEGSYWSPLGRWSDGTVRWQVGLVDADHPDRRVTIDGRFPNWVAETTANRPVLASNVQTQARSRLRHVRTVFGLAYFGAIGFETARVFGL